MPRDLFAEQPKDLLVDNPPKDLFADPAIIPLQLAHQQIPPVAGPGTPLLPAHKPTEAPPPGLPSIAATLEAVPTKEKFLAQRSAEMTTPVESAFPEVGRWGQAWLKAVTGQIPVEEFQFIEKQTGMEDGINKMSQLSGIVAGLIYGRQIGKAGLDIYRMAKSEFRDLSKITKILGKGIDFGKEVVNRLRGQQAISEEAQVVLSKFLNGTFTPTDLRALKKSKPSLFEEVQRIIPGMEPEVKGLLPAPAPKSFTRQALDILKSERASIPPFKAPSVSSYELRPPERPIAEKLYQPLESVVSGAEGLENVSLSLARNSGKIAQIFTRFLDLPEETRQAFINISEGDEIRRQFSAKAAVDIFKNFDNPTLESLYRHLQEPDKYSLPPGTEEVANTAREITKWSFRELNKLGLKSKKDIELLEKVVDKDLPIPDELKGKLNIPKWPDNRLEALANEKAKLEVKIKDMTGRPPAERFELDPKVELQAQLDEVNRNIGKLENVKYFHQISIPPKGLKKGGVIGRQFRKPITAKAKRLLGRTFPTREEARAAGYEVGSLPAAVADVIDQTNQSIQMDQFIKYINRNPDFSKRADQAPGDWVSIDERTFPSGKYKKFHPAIADALHEISYSSNKHPLMKAYDKLNSTMKIIGFYNPIFMTRYNVSQGIRAAGFSSQAKLPEAIKIWRDKSETYSHLAKNGLFNNVFDLKPAMTDVTDAMMDSVRKSKAPPDFKKLAGQILNPIALTKSTWKTLNEGTWKIDEVQRIATWLAMKDKPRLKRHYSDFEIIELVNDFHANYGKVPRGTRETLNRGVFTPTYKISMARIVGRMHREPKALWPSLLRHYAMKIAFNKFIPMAFGAYYAYKKLDKRADVKGYRLIITDPKDKKETVYSISDPLLEGTKILNRPWRRTVEYNLAAMPSILLNTLRGPLFKDRNIPNWANKLNALFKTGAPVLKEWLLWQKEDKETFQKFMQSVGLAFIYKRNKQELKGKEDHIALQLVKAMGLWTDWKETVFKKEREKRYYYIKKPKKKKRIVP